VSLAESFAGTSRFRILRRLGMGGMGVVYEALDQERNTRVALKTLRLLEPQLLLRFKQEFRALQGLDHPNLVSLLELHSEGGSWFFTMELIEGVDILRWVRNEESVIRDSDAETEENISPSMVTEPGGRSEMRRLVSGRFDERRLRSSLSQLAMGLARLHDAGKVHRDIKPSNILVRPDGRVVILDFGLVAELDHGRTSDSSVVGTVDYMAPEQAAGQAVGAPADWYSVGVLLYEALTGITPFSGSPLTVLQEKQVHTPRPPSSYVDCPPDLDELCMRLLAIDPEMRPDEALLISGSPAKKSLPAHQSFIGRARELQLLDDAFEEVKRGQQVQLFIDGPSGVGKSALVRQFTRRLPPDVVVLTSRYYEREVVPFRALDAVMDALAQHLIKLPSDAAAAILPIDTGVLAQQFPSLRGVEAVSRGAFRPAPLDPQEQRTRVFGAVREMMIRLSRRSPVVVVIEDVQWADPDSRVIFIEAMRGPDGPHLLAISTHRSRPGDPTVSERALAYLRQLGPVRHLELGRLLPDDAKELAARLIGSIGDAPQLNPQLLAEEADGHPLFIDTLVRHALAHGGDTKVRLDDALAARIDSLEERARHLLELIALSAGPLGHHDAQRSTGLDSPELSRALTALRQEHLVRPTRERDQDAYEPHHDRVRELTAKRLDSPRRRGRHEELARALEASGYADPDSLFAHWRAAGRLDRATEYGAQAAARASAALAFDRAARLYKEVISLRSDRKLLVSLGDALANGGRGPEAAEIYRAALAGASRDEEWELKRKIAEQLLRSGRIDEGMAAVRAVLDAVGLTLPKTPRRALALLVLNRARIRMRGLGFRERPLSEVPPALLSRIDTTWSVSGVLGMVDTIRGAYFQALHLRLALRAGEPFRVARALGLEVAFSAVDGGRSAKYTASVVARAEALTKRVDDPYVTGWHLGTAGLAAALEGRWRVGMQLSREAEELIRSRCGNIAWELSSFQFFHVYSLWHLGKMREMQERVPKYLREASERGDLYGAATNRLALANMIWLCADRPDEAQRQVAEALAHWSRDGFQLEHYWAMLASANAELYSGDAEAAWKRVQASWKKMAATLLLRVQLTRIEAQHLLARMAIAQGSPELLKSARKNSANIKSEKMPWATPLAHLIDAGAFAVEAKNDEAARALELAIAGCEATEMALYAYCARRQLAKLRGDQQGLAAADDWMRGEAIVRPDRMTQLLIPGFK
jgi:serine/threonine protein kinase/DNA-binding transcriptional ArsR family regulator